MVAPNGARRGKGDHPALPVTDDELIATAIACHAAGADGIHAHLRDEDGVHLIDAGRYTDLLARLSDAVPGMYLQVTSESAGRYGAAEQREMMHALKPRHVSVALREMVRSPDDWDEAAALYHWAADEGVEIQHILYAPDEVDTFVAALGAGRIPGQHHLIQFVRGTYANGENGALPLADYVAPLTAASDHSFDWMLCAFGRSETPSLVEAAELGGKARAGFENSLHMANGTLAPDNAARIHEVDAALKARGY